MRHHRHRWFLRRIAKDLTPSLQINQFVCIAPILFTIVNGIGALPLLISTTGIPMYKVFQSQDFNKYDEPARDRAKAFWSSLGYSCKDHDNEYDVDLIVEGNGKRFYCEVEVKTVWHGIEFKYESIHIPVRKAKFLGKPTQFMVFNNSLTHAAIISRKTVLQSPKVEVPNIKIRFGEKFFDIPKDKAVFVQTI